MNEISFAHILFATACPRSPFDMLRAVSPAKRGIERPSRACPVLTGWAGSFNIFAQEKGGMMMDGKLMEYFNKQPRLGCLSTSGKNGKVDVACFGSPRMVDGKTVVMALRKSRTFENLQGNPNAVFMIMEPGKTSLDWKGVRVYLKMKGYETSGENLERARVHAAKAAGEEAAKALHAVVTFAVEEVRPIVDSGQGWEKSI